ncbi:MAG: zinc ribbon domain-containing protein [Dehalococcoidia bacterium]|nr:zinc ribbon domain-containing protein [Dehalococcoidia bacterium]
MPVYEYDCGNCKRRVSIFVRGFDQPDSLKCPECGGQDLSRRFSKFGIGKGESYLRKGIYEDMLTDRNLMRGLKANDTRALAEWNRRMTHGCGEDITPESEDLMAKMDAGAPWDQVVADAKATYGELGGGEE